MNDNNVFRDKLIKTFEAFDLFCKEHDIKYFAGYGTLIGAVRHNGLIPWDDDVDVCMLKEDYDKFCSLRGKVNGHYEIMDERDHNYWLPLLVKFVDTDTTLWEVEEYPCVTGVYIDIFPLYECNSENAKKQKSEFDRYLRFFRRSMRHYTFRNVITAILGCHLYSFFEILKDLLYYKPLHIVCKWKYDRFLKNIKNQHGDRYVSFAGDYGEREIYRKELFQDVVKLKYEDLEIDAPKEYHKILTQLYGDYMQLPPEEKRVTNHPHCFLDLHRRWNIEEIRRIKKL